MPIGHTNNPNGRPKGTPNKNTAAIRDNFRKFIEDNIKTITEDFKALEDPKDRLYFITHIAEFVLPKLQRTEISIDPENPIEVTLTDEQLKESIKRIISGADGGTKAKAVSSN